jgi:hypothetical protein
LPVASSSASAADLTELRRKKDEVLNVECLHVPPFGMALGRPGERQQRTENESGHVERD